eukprot:CAMPEP_0113237112 /NCGR_PEP_ID=MMETSP0008_2-20120614/4454_1 /TAXON_ID=97485 /ORGANISM="Prymnesium parvum" /LENGTH=105 /DNA_ID=CAMNT_0000084161 /DNA_START=1353 /DNA_END=1670 /DNA_ORIENTATION=+ /assembly_acc=CAM_ASM_000153
MRDAMRFGSDVDSVLRSHTNMRDAIARKSVSSSRARARGAERRTTIDNDESLDPRASRRAPSRGEFIIMSCNLSGDTFVCANSAVSCASTLRQSACPMAAATSSA